MSIGKDSQSTCYVLLFENPDYFAIQYYERIWRAFLARCRNPARADDLTQQFFERKVLEGKLLEKFRQSLESVMPEGGPTGVNASALPSFRKFLYRSVDNFYVDHYRKSKKHDAPNFDPQEHDGLVTAEARDLDPDALYALSVLHQAAQSVRNHFRKKNKPRHWELFESLVLAEYLTGATPVSLEELRQRHFPGSRDNQDIHNCLTTVKRVFQKVLITYFESESDDPATSDELFHEWMEIIRRSNASLHSALQAAYRTVDIPSADASMAASAGMVRYEGVDSRETDHPIDNDEMAILLSFRLDLPLHQWVNGDRMMAILPRKSTRASNELAARFRELSMSSLMDPDQSAAALMGTVSMIDVLRLVKDESKRLTKTGDGTFPKNIHKLFYTLAASIAAYCNDTRLSTLDERSMLSNLRWYLEQPWLDDRVRTLFREILAVRA